MKKYILFLLLILCMQVKAEKLFISQCLQNNYYSKFDHILDELYYKNEQYFIAHGFNRDDFCIKLSKMRETSITNSKENYGIIFVNVNDKDFISNEIVLAGVLAHEMAHIINHHGTKQLFTPLMKKDELNLNDKLVNISSAQKNVLDKLKTEIDHYLELLPQNIQTKLKDYSLFSRWLFPTFDEKLIDKATELTSKEKAIVLDRLNMFNIESYNILSREFQYLEKEYNRTKQELVNLYDSRRGINRLFSFEEREADKIGLELYLSLGYDLENYFPFKKITRSFTDRIFGRKKCKISDIKDVPMASQDHPTYCYRVKAASEHYIKLNK